MSQPSLGTRPLAGNLKACYRVCQPEVALPAGDPYYTDLTASNVRGSVPVMRRIFAAIDMSTEGPGVGESYSQEAFPKVLITGHRGCGKTTELNALADRLRESGYFVVQMAADQLLDLSEVGWQDLLLELAYQVFEQGSGARRELRCAPDPGLHEQVYQVLDSTILKNVATTTLEGKVATEIEAATPAPFLKLKAVFSNLIRSSSERVKEVRKQIEPRSEQFHQDLDRFLSDFQRRLRECGHRGMVVIVDGLEKIKLPDDGDRSMLHRLYVDGSEHLKAVACPVIYTVPVMLRYDYNLGDIYGTSVFMLPMVKVRDKARCRWAPGMHALRRLLERRILLDAVFDEDALDRLIEASGGHTRDLLRLVQEACQVALEADAARVNDLVAQSAIRNFANDNYLRLCWERIAQLAEVRERQWLELSHGVLAQQLMVMEYRNTDPWHDLHPCIEYLDEVWKRVTRLSDPPSPDSGAP